MVGGGPVTLLKRARGLMGETMKLYFDDVAFDG
jgi:hypothetical protein